MQSEFNKWLTELSEYAEQKGITIEAKYYDGLDYMYKSGLNVVAALPCYIDLIKRMAEYLYKWCTMLPVPR